MPLAGGRGVPLTWLTMSAVPGDVGGETPVPCALAGAEHAVGSGGLVDPGRGSKSHSGRGSPVLVLLPRLQRASYRGTGFSRG